MVRMKFLGAGLGLALAMTVATPASAAIITFTPDFEYSGSGDDYTGVITFTLEDVVGGVQFSIDWAEPAVPDGGQFFTGAYLNVDPAINPTSVTLPAGFGTCTGCALSVFASGANAFGAAGGGLFDLFFGFPTANQGGRFEQGDSYTVLLGGPITTDSFLFESSPSGGNGTWQAVARVQGLGLRNGGSGWFGDDTPDIPNVPEPALLTLFGLGLAVGASRLRQARG
jgi:hypothetical protein